MTLSPSLLLRPRSLNLCLSQPLRRWMRGRWRSLRHAGYQWQSRSCRIMNLSRRQSRTTSPLKFQRTSSVTDSLSAVLSCVLLLLLLFFHFLFVVGPSASRERYAPSSTYSFPRRRGDPGEQWRERERTGMAMRDGLIWFRTVMGLTGRGNQATFQYYRESRTGETLQITRGSFPVLKFFPFKVLDEIRSTIMDQGK